MKLLNRFFKLEVGFYSVLLALLVGIHFHSSEILSRQLINYDDSTTIAPLANLSLGDYFSTWVIRQHHYLDFLRDLTYYLDFELGRWTGIQFFWLSNFAYFILTLWVLNQVAGLLFPHYRRLRWFLIALIALHPWSVEWVQWATMRKHLLVWFFVACGTCRAVRIRQKNQSPQLRDWIFFLVNYFASILCFPTGILWFSWILYYFRKRLATERKKFLALAGLNGLLIVLFAGLFIFPSVDFTFRLHSLLIHLKGVVAFEHILGGVGRGFFNFIFPLWVAPYYQFGTFSGWLGLVLLVGALGGLLIQARQKSSGLDFILLAAALFTPACFGLWTADEFLFADRYFEMPLPYFLFAVVLMLGLNFQKKMDYFLSLKWGGLASGLLLVLLTVRSAIAVSPWEDDLSLMKNCAQTEGSSRCLILTIEKQYELQGCSSLESYLGQAERNYNLFSKHDILFRIEVPFFKGLCIAMQDSVDPVVKMKEFSDLKVRYPNEDSVLFSEVILNLRNGESRKARQLAFSTYLEPQYEPKDLDEKLINVLAGQAHMLCEINDPLRLECNQRAEAFYARYSRVPVNTAYVLWGGMVTIQQQGWDP